MAFGNVGLASSFVSRYPMSESTSFCSGCFAPGGGIRRPRSLRTAFSQVAASFATASTFRLSSASPPTLALELWQVVQYALIVALASSDEPAVVAAAAGGDPAAGRVWAWAVAINARRAPRSNGLFIVKVFRSLRFSKNIDGSLGSPSISSDKSVLDIYARDRLPDTKKRFFSPGQCWGSAYWSRRCSFKSSMDSPQIGRASCRERV